ncbi:hypothetical protein GCM10010446_11440 [Streptomyces enissocaesilis]|uniref:Uncharacterized protein n=2 Tax=Streptomyces enissocaesilis TaxID=332589 RepID=A0ABN3WUT0_9ACTN
MYDSRQTECCGEPIPVGDEVRWRLMLRGPHEGAAPETWQDNRSALEPAGHGLVGGPGLTALCAGKPSAHPVGLLAVETHGPGPDDVPETAGTVRSLQVVVEGYAVTRAGGRTYEPVPGERRPRAADTRPKWFGDTAEPDRADRGHRRTETGVLAGLGAPGGTATARLGQ